MYKHLLKSTFRRLARSKSYTLTNVLGLGLGLACGLLSLLYTLDQRGYDHHNEHYDRICRVLCQDTQFDWLSPKTPAPLAAEIKQSVTGVEKVARVGRISCALAPPDGSGQRLSTVLADEELFDVLTLPILVGNPREVFTSSHSVVVSESAAGSLFGESNPVGEQLILNPGGADISLTVSAVMEDAADHVTLPVEVVVSSDVLGEFWEKSYGVAAGEVESWRFNPISTYVLLEENADRAAVSRQIATLTASQGDDATRWDYSLQPMSDFYFGSNGLVNDNLVSGSRTALYLVISLALAVLFLASVNYVVLATAQSTTRAREIGVRKVLGASRRALAAQVLSQSLATSLIALPLALVAVELVLPHANRLFHTSLTISYGRDWVFLLVALAITLVVGSVSGAYVALHLVRLDPAEAFRERQVISNRRTAVRRLLVMIQLTVFAVMVACTVVVMKQLHFATGQDLGFKKENLVTAWIYNSGNSTLTRERLKQKLATHSQVESFVLGGGLPPTDSYSVSKMCRLDDSSTIVDVESSYVGFGYCDTYSLDLVSGRAFDPDLDPTDGTHVLLNETAVRELGIQGDPVGQVLQGQATIVGVIKDFHLHSFRKRIPPLMSVLYTASPYQVTIKIAAGDPTQTLHDLRSMFEQDFPGEITDVAFVDDVLDAMYRRENRVKTMVLYSALLAVVIAALGLSALAAFLAEQRTKEIGIRRVLGANSGSIVVLLCKEFVLLSCTAVIVSIPIAWYLSHQWLSTFAYQTNFGWEPVLVATVLALAITAGMAAWRAVQVARRDPVQTLRYE